MTAPLQPPEQLRYARWLEWGTRMGLVALVLLFALYASGLGTPWVPLEQLPQLWRQPVQPFLQATGMPTGWGWLAHLGRTDVNNLAGIVVLAGCSVPALLALVPLAWRRGDRRLAALCLAQCVVVLLAASGWLVGGH